MGAKEEYRAKLFGVPEVSSEDEVRWCFRRWDLEKIQFFHPINVIVTFESAVDLDAALAPGNKFVIRGHPILIEEECPKKSDEDEKLMVAVTSPVDLDKPIVAEKSADDEPSTEETPFTSNAVEHKETLKNPTDNLVDEYLQYINALESPAEPTASVAPTENDEPIVKGTAEPTSAAPTKDDEPVEKVVNEESLESSDSHEPVAAEMPTPIYELSKFEDDLEELVKSLEKTEEPKIISNGVEPPTEESAETNNEAAYLAALSQIQKPVPALAAKPPVALSSRPEDAEKAVSAGNPSKAQALTSHVAASAKAAPVKYVEDFKRPKASVALPDKSIVADATPVPPGMCLFCGGTAGRMCSKCGRFYCSTVCQTIDWASHARICSDMPELVAAAKHIPTGPTGPTHRPTHEQGFVANAASTNRFISRSGSENGYGPKSAPFHGNGPKPFQPSNGQDPRSAARGNAPQQNANKTQPPPNRFQNGHTQQSNANAVAPAFLKNGSSSANASNAAGHMNPFRKEVAIQEELSRFGSKPKVDANRFAGNANPSSIRPLMETIVTAPLKKQSETPKDSTTDLAIRFTRPPSASSATKPPPPVSSITQLKPAFNAGPASVLKPQLPSLTSQPKAASPIYAPLPIPSPVVPRPPPTSDGAPKSLPFCEFPSTSSLVMITDVISDKHVFVRSLDETHDDEYCSTLAAVALYATTKAAQLDAMPTVGRMVLAPNPTQPTSMRRALVLKTIGLAQLLVAFIDFGSVSTPLLTDCRELSTELQLRRRLVHRCTISEMTASTHNLAALKASPWLICYKEPFTPATLVDLIKA